MTDYDISTREAAKITLQHIFQELDQPSPAHRELALVDLLDAIAIKYPDLQPDPPQPTHWLSRLPDWAHYILQGVASFLFFAALVAIAYPFAKAFGPLVGLLALGGLFWLAERFLSRKAKTK